MRRESYSAATQCSLDTFYHTCITSHLVNYNSGSKMLRVMDRKFKNERTPRQAFAKPGTRAGVNAR